ncbi:hypothetical protein [Methanospirillum sp.]|uniref:hypothetical protein n=1 Tax=Methanospirillum sp. TaxID=45200 RepID=UPI00359F24FD
MVEVNELYEIALYPSEWNAVVKEFQINQNKGEATKIERTIGGNLVICEVMGYSWNQTKKPDTPLKQKIKVQIMGIVKNQEILENTAS